MKDIPSSLPTVSAFAETIVSLKDERIVLARMVNTHQGREAYQRILLEGEEIVDWALENAVEVEFILSSSRNGLSMVYLVPAKETNHQAQAYP